MLLLLLCIVVNTLIVVIFDFFGKNKVNNLHAIVVNYWVCVIVGSLIIKAPVVTIDVVDKPYFLYSFGLGGLFITVFNFVAKSVQGFGLTIATIFQKMSLLAPAIIAMTFFNESATVFKIIGILLAILSIFVLSKKEDHEEHQHTLADWIFPIGTFVGSCIIDSVLYIVNVNGIANNGDIRFVGTLFFFAALFGLLFLVYDIVILKHKFELRSIGYGILLGVPNFFSIYLLLLVLDQGLGGSVVFPINNVGILSLSAITGFFIFKEKFGRYKFIGLALAILSIITIANG